MTTPFYPYPADYAGAAPSTPSSWSGGSRRMWLGKAGAMFEMPSPSSTNLSSPRSRGTVAQQTASGATGTTILPNTVRAHSYSWPVLTGRDWAVVQMFHDRTPQSIGGPGNGPWCLVHPEGRNRLTYRQSMCGGITGSVEGWGVTGGTVAFASGVAAYETPGGVMLWTPGAAGRVLFGGDAASAAVAPDTNLSAPYLPAEFTAFAAMVRTASGSAQVQARLAGYGGSATSVTGGTVTASSTSWVPVSVVAGPAGLGTSQYVLPALVSVDGNPVQVCNPVLSYTSAPLEWSQGEGVPQVVMSSELTRDLTLSLRSGSALVLSEAVTGAA